MIPPELPQRRTHLLFVAIVIVILMGLSLKGAPVSVEKARAELIRWEGYRQMPYRDGPGWSVGVGHSLTANAEVVKPRYTRAEVERLFLRDLSWALDTCREGIDRFDDLPEAIQIVCLSVAWTTGREGFKRFRGFRLAVGNRAYNAAAHQLAASKWASQVGPTRRDHHVGVLLRY